MPSRGVGGATNQSLPNASVALASSSDRNAYVPLARSGPMTLSAQRPSSIAWYGCMLAITPSCAEARDVGGRDVLGVLHAEATVARPVLLRDALVRVEQRANGAIADGVDDDVQPGLVRA